MGFKDLETKVQKAIVGCSLAATLVGMFCAHDMWVNYCASKHNPPVITQDINGNDKPEVYIEVNGNKYFTVFDGKEVGK